MYWIITETCNFSVLLYPKLSDSNLIFYTTLWISIYLLYFLKSTLRLFGYFLVHIHFIWKYFILIGDLDPDIWYTLSKKADISSSLLELESISPVRRRNIKRIDKSEQDTSEGNIIQHEYIQEIPALNDPNIYDYSISQYKNPQHVSCTNGKHICDCSLQEYINKCKIGDIQDENILKTVSITTCSLNETLLTQDTSVSSKSSSPVSCFHEQNNSFNRTMVYLCKSIDISYCYCGNTNSPCSHIVLRNISFEIYNREVIFVTGPSKSGKSTLLKFISGYIGIYKLDGNTKLFTTEESKTRIYLYNKGILNSSKNVLQYYRQQEQGYNIYAYILAGNDYNKEKLDLVCKLCLLNSTSNLNNLFIDDIYRDDELFLLSLAQFFYSLPLLENSSSSEFNNYLLVVLDDIFSEILPPTCFQLVKQFVYVNNFKLLNISFIINLDLSWADILINLIQTSTSKGDNIDTRNIRLLKLTEFGEIEYFGKLFYNLNVDNDSTFTDQSDLNYLKDNLRFPVDLSEIQNNNVIPESKEVIRSIEGKSRLRSLTIIPLIIFIGIIVSIFKQTYLIKLVNSPNIVNIEPAYILQYVSISATSRANNAYNSLILSNPIPIFWSIINPIVLMLFTVSNHGTRKLEKTESYNLIYEDKKNDLISVTDMLPKPEFMNMKQNKGSKSFLYIEGMENISFRFGNSTNNYSNMKHNSQNTISLPHIHIIGVNNALMAANWVKNSLIISRNVRHTKEITSELSRNSERKYHYSSIFSLFLVSYAIDFIAIVFIEKICFGKYHDSLHFWLNRILSEVYKSKDPIRLIKEIFSSRKGIIYMAINSQLDKNVTKYCNLFEKIHYICISLGILYNYISLSSEISINVSILNKYIILLLILFLITYNFLIILKQNSNIKILTKKFRSSIINLLECDAYEKSDFFYILKFSQFSNILEYIYCSFLKQRNEYKQKLNKLSLYTQISFFFSSFLFAIFLSVILINSINLCIILIFIPCIYLIISGIFENENGNNPNINEVLKSISSTRVTKKAPNLEFDNISKDAVILTEMTTPSPKKRTHGSASSIYSSSYTTTSSRSSRSIFAERCPLMYEFPKNISNLINKSDLANKNNRFIGIYKGIFDIGTYSYGSSHSLLFPLTWLSNHSNYNISCMDSKYKVENYSTNFQIQFENYNKEFYMSKEKIESIAIISDDIKLPLHWTLRQILDPKSSYFNDENKLIHVLSDLKLLTHNMKMLNKNDLLSLTFQQFIHYHHINKSVKTKCECVTSVKEMNSTISKTDNTHIQYIGYSTIEKLVLLSYYILNKQNYKFFIIHLDTNMRWELWSRIIKQYITFYDIKIIIITLKYNALRCCDKVFNSP
ncbi:uncharacterized protein CMU_029060 [Cryptosporidium muris RN66]|uniref:ABC transporter domain-containing protein n=1 Tax=Cryptosporidium muris (strain RN66) TaxID=441375 RepID=B6AHZ1_CRYMR|nr:uncharacterized protein CMU_029060 [Cryptosporidium muris RN66]EEA07832.1 hypothetical protein CMU_029060 [Cryptosporidium muris RN66]|eukprot:XP_002142181.1 hypothetical protein [Cryptosporidium muris RN66]